MMLLDTFVQVVNETTRHGDRQNDALIKEYTDHDASGRAIPIKMRLRGGLNWAWLMRSYLSFLGSKLNWGLAILMRCQPPIQVIFAI